MPGTYRESDHHLDEKRPLHSRTISNRLAKPSQVSVRTASTPIPFAMANQVRRQFGGARLLRWMEQLIASSATL
jgi:hypothetical protein